MVKLASCANAFVRAARSSGRVRFSLLFQSTSSLIEKMSSSSAVSGQPIRYGNFQMICRRPRVAFSGDHLTCNLPGYDDFRLSFRHWIIHVKFPRDFRGQIASVSEIEFRTPYVVAERWIVARRLRFMHAKNLHSDTL